MKKKTKKSLWGKKMVFVLNVEPYSQQVIVVCNGQVSDAVKLLKKQKSKNAQETIDYIESHAAEYKDEYKLNSGTAYIYTELPKGYIILVSHQDSWVATTALVVHECLHLVFTVLKRAGMELSGDSEEAYTYLQQRLICEILNRLY